MLKLKRVYAAADREDGIRILVDRLWPRGISKAEACVDRWMKQVAPTDKLRKWFGHDPSRWDDFRKRYTAELAAMHERMSELRKLARGKTVTLLYGAKDEEHNHAIVLRDVLRRRKSS